jgi:hypothetical protein
MKVHELIALLSGADPEAIVLIFPPYADPSDGGPVWDVVVEEHAWTRETGLCQGRRYETFYPWGLIPRHQPKLQQKKCGLFSSERSSAIFARRRSRLFPQSECSLIKRPSRGKDANDKPFRSHRHRPIRGSDLELHR